MAENNANNGLVSIVIPVYNAEKYLERLIDSIFAQTHKNIEVIAAYESASTDNTLDVLQNLAKKYPLIISIGSERCPGGTRNRGFEYATGEFVVFVDADDYLLPDYLSSFLHVFREHPELDVVCCDYYTIDENTEFTVRTNCTEIPKYRVFDSKTWIKRLLQGKEHVMPWLYMIRSSFIKNKRLQFPAMYYGEDDAFQYLIASQTKEIGKIDSKTYAYVIRNSSICNTRDILWFDESQSAYNLIPRILNNASLHNLSKEYDIIHKRMLAFLSVDCFDYNNWREYLKRHNIRILKYKHLRKKTAGGCAVTMFNVSKKMFYLAKQRYNNYME